MSCSRLRGCQGLCTSSSCHRGWRFCVSGSGRLCATRVTLFCMDAVSLTYSHRGIYTPCGGKGWQWSHTCEFLHDLTVPERLKLHKMAVELMQRGHRRRDHDISWLNVHITQSNRIKAQTLRVTTLPLETWCEALEGVYGVLQECHKLEA